MRNVETPYLASFRGKRTVRRAHGCAGLGCRKKRMSSCNGADTGCNITRPEREPTSDWSFFAETLQDRFQEGKQMTTISVGAPSASMDDWKAINWRHSATEAQRLQMRIAKVVRVRRTTGSRSRSAFEGLEPYVGKLACTVLREVRGG